MELDDFVDGEEVKSGHSKGGSTGKYSRSELVDEIKRFKQENGKITRKLFDDNDDFPSSNPIRREFGSWNKGLQAAIGDVNIEQTYSVAEWEAYLDILKAASKYGKDVTVKDMLDDDELLCRSAIENATGMKFNQVKRHLGLATNSEKDISKDRIISELEELEPPIKSTKVNKECSFGHTVVAKYGDGSFTQGLIHLGFDVTSIQHITSNYKKQSSKRARRMLERNNNYDETYSACVYVIKLVTKSNAEWFYVGKVNQGSSMHRRLASHLTKKGDFAKELNVETVELYDIMQVDSQGLDEKEREVSYEVAIEENTTNVLGGK